MAVNYNKLWKRLIDAKMNRTQLRVAAQISTNAVAKLGKNEPVSFETLEKICRTLNCDVGDIMEIEFDTAENVVEKRYTHVDCFSGPGGICTGFHAAGIDTLLAIEYIQSCVDTYQKNHPKVHIIQSDIRKVSADQIIPYIPKDVVDIVTSGMPCETFSTAGNTSRSFYDERQFLFREGIRIAKICNAKLI